jgi:hypothetical protein
MGPKTRQAMIETCQTMRKYVEDHKNAHGPGVRVGGATSGGGYIVPTHDKESHKREIQFWDRREAMYRERP